MLGAPRTYAYTIRAQERDIKGGKTDKDKDDLDPR